VTLGHPRDRTFALPVEDALPMIVVPVSIVPTPASTLGTRSTSSNAAVLRASVRSSSPPPSM
jgi:hypothetical protein